MDSNADPINSGVNANDAGWPTPEDGTIIRRVGGSDWSVYTENPSGSPYPLSAESAFALPLDSALLYFLTRGGGNVGDVNIVNSDVARNKVDVRVHVNYHRQEALDHANVCLLKKEKEDGEGVGIFTPNGWHPTDRLDRMHFTVTVTFPATSDGSPLKIKDFESTTSHYSHQIADLRGTVYFGVFTIGSDSAGITSESIFAGSGTFKATKGAIKGAFNVSSSLELTTTDANITARVGLRNDVASYLAGNQTSDSSTHSDAGTGGNFKVSATTVKAPITLTHISSPIDSIQNLVVSTVYAPVTVSLNNAYEGGFTLNSSYSPLTVVKSGATDPSGQGRERVLKKDSQSSDHVTGSVYWNPNSGPGVSQGSVQITTSKSPIRLTV
ncbi:hypothetical protein SERLA73DRAFT_105194 [Serpula lacrymans var. lacrymans S7.3]|uniref:Uncharacterized protein n=2 Tax=Serpula lacrymans var. lacrymans TaxID=341189 RepID=F8PSN8_SERL3|nr:uncharacterized protein SERLADRAFT_414428 [Serpula lacrymans var. lacrymans S7.9]EGO00797.1 hypothetical protein SERLA73DRAFT_105194 [Serpula lacrymans var. lacrymans S7.3]EGO26358.1 hypothetical protein SERLADRAFT_414428 [Serpula lacrymans var. lacrymans S7.9]